MNDLKYAFRQLVKNPGFTAVVVLTLAAVSTNGLAVETPEPLAKSATPSAPPSAKAIIAKYVEAIGGRDAILKHGSCHWSGKFDLPAQQVSGSLDVFGAQPHKQLMKVNIPGAGKYLRAFDGRIAWTFDPQEGSRAGTNWTYHAKQGLRRRSLDDRYPLNDVFDLYASLHDEKDFVSLKTAGTAPFEGRECYQLEIIRSRGQVLTEFYDAGSGLLAGMAYGGDKPETIVLEDYREFDGVKIPTRVSRKERGTVKDLFTIASVEFTPVVDSVFAMPVHVPDWPANWHQIDEAYPPGFAKNLPWPWKGEHNRWFNDGFDKADESFFWSYVVFNALEGDTLKTRDELADALKRYDGSLYGDAFPPDKIKVSVGAEQKAEKLGHAVTRRSVTIDGFDAEATKKELTTHLEVFRWYCPAADRTGFLILRSPRPFKDDDAVWKVLLFFWDKITCHITDK